MAARIVLGLVILIVIALAAGLLALQTPWAHERIRRLAVDQANRFLTLLTNALTGLNLSDMEVGYKVFRADVLRGLTLTSDRFGIEPEITIKVARNGCRIYEVPIRYYGRTYSEGKKITWRDGLAAIGHILRYRFLA